MRIHLSTPLQDLVLLEWKVFNNMSTQDILLLNDLLSDEELSIQQTTRDFCQNQLMPRIIEANRNEIFDRDIYCLLYTSPSPRDGLLSRMPSSA